MINKFNSVCVFTSLFKTKFVFILKLLGKIDIEYRPYLPNKLVQHGRTSKEGLNLCYCFDTFKY